MRSAHSFGYASPALRLRLRLRLLLLLLLGFVKWQLNEKQHGVESNEAAGSRQRTIKAAQAT